MSNPDHPPPYRSLAFIGLLAPVAAVVIPMIAILGVPTGLGGRWLWASPCLLVVGLGASLLARYNAAVHGDRSAQRIALSGVVIAVGSLAVLLLGTLALVVALSGLED
ncbi:MAG: hypothetical protein AB7O78_03195 [Thermoleophilia bacterium]